LDVFHFQVDLHLPSLPEFGQNPSRGPTPAQGEMSAKPLHCWDQGYSGKAPFYCNFRRPHIFRPTFFNSFCEL
jgi:hypothetical protein